VSNGDIDAKSGTINGKKLAISGDTNGTMYIQARECEPSNGIGFTLQTQHTEGLVDALIIDSQGNVVISKNVTVKGEIRCRMRDKNDCLRAIYVDNDHNNLSRDEKNQLKGGVNIRGYVVSSDSHLKKVIQPLQNATEKPTRLQGVHFAWNEQGLHEKTKHVEESLRSTEDTPEANQKVWEKEKERIRKEHSGTYKGFIAQEVEKVFPEWVQENEAGYKTIRMDELNVVLVEAVKELKAENDALKAQNKSILDRVEALEKRL